MNSIAAKLTLWLFLLVGIAILVLLPGRQARNYYVSQSWEPVDAFIVSAKIDEYSERLPDKRTHTKKGSYVAPKNRGRHVTKYKVQSRFRYDYLGRSFVSITPTLNKGGSSNPEFAQTLLLRLQEAQRSNSPVTAYVNPAKPEQAVIDRSVNWLASLIGGVFGLLFVLVPGILLWRMA